MGGGGGGVDGVWELYSRVGFSVCLDIVEFFFLIFTLSSRGMVVVRGSAGSGVTNRGGCCCVVPGVLRLYLQVSCYGSLGLIPYLGGGCEGRRSFQGLLERCIPVATGHQVSLAIL